MERKTIFLIIFVGFISAGAVLTATKVPELDIKSDESTDKDTDHETIQSPNFEEATFAGGCFWCIEAVFEDREGVQAAVSGYAGGKESTASYQQVSTGRTEHREAVRVLYNSSKISYNRLLDIYWKSIDPTDPGGQFADRGPEYTTAIYTHDQRQRKLAEESKENLSQSEKFEEPIATEVENYTTFFRAEERHQNYSQKNTLQYRAYERASGRKGFIEKVWEDSPFSSK